LTVVLKGENQGNGGWNIGRRSEVQRMGNAIRETSKGSARARGPGNKIPKGRSLNNSLR